MKKLKLLALALLIGTASIFAANGDNPVEANKRIRSQIVDLLQTPEFGVEKEINVMLTFTFSSAGEIVILNVDSKNQDVLNYLRGNLNYKKVKSPGERDKLYTMPLKLKTK